MIPTSKPKITSNIDQLESQEFSMLVGEKAFSILVDSLYTDKVLAAVRELCTNAVDAHQVAGKQSEPFKVTLPTYLDNTFSVRDYGCSMDHYTIMNLYSKLFWSPKDTTNTQVGYLGLGSKAPLAYTDSFSVIAYLSGIRRDYLVGLNHERIPTITKVNEVSTSELDGLEVSFPVKMGDSDLFERAAEKVFLGMDVKPVCNIKIYLPEPKLEFENWKIYTGAHGNKFFIKQGCVLYPFNFTSRLLKHYSSNSMVIEVPIGSVEVATSREALSLDDRTRTFIEQLTKELNCSVERYLNEQLAAQKNTIDAAIFLYGKIQPIFDETYTKNLELNYKGKKLERYIKFDLTIPVEYLSNGKSWLTKTTVAIDVNNLSTAKFVIQKAGQKVYRRKARIKAYMKDQHGPQGAQIYFLDGPSNKDISRLLRFYILPKNIIPIEKIPDIETTSSGKKLVAKTGPYIYIKDGHQLVDNMENEFAWVDINRKNGDFIIDYSKNRITSSKDWGAYTYKEFNELLHYFDITDKPIYHLTPSMQKKFKVDDSNKIDTIIKDWFDENSLNLKTAYFLHHFVCEPMFQNIIEEKIAPKGYRDWAGNKSLRYICRAIKKFNASQESKWQVELDKEMELLNNKYPMIGHSSPTTEQKINYVKMMDGQQNV